MIVYSKRHKKYIIARISEESFGLVKNMTWTLNNNGYLITRINKKYVLLHRYVLKLTSDDKCCVDHINRNIFDNRIVNLRKVTSSINIINSKIMSNNTSGYKGITWDKTRDKWKVSLSMNKHTYNIGRFDDLESAIKARREAEEKYHREFLPII